MEQSGSDSEWDCLCNYNGLPPKAGVEAKVEMDVEEIVSAAESSEWESLFFSERNIKSNLQPHQPDASPHPAQSMMPSERRRGRPKGSYGSNLLRQDLKRQAAEEAAAAPQPGQIEYARIARAKYAEERSRLAFFVNKLWV